MTTIDSAFGDDLHGKRVTIRVTGQPATVIGLFSGNVWCIRIDGALARSYATADELAESSPQS
jgi:hypothetical protein